MKNNLYALIMAGGGGTRLWPLSRKNRPKQMLSLVEEKTMFQVSVERLAPLLPPDHIFIVTGPDLAGPLSASVPQVPVENFIIEPFGQNSGPAAGLGTLHIRRRDPDAVIAMLTSDHHIADREKFRAVLAAASSIAAQDYIVTLGISPSFPSTGFGYIKRGAPLTAVGEFQAYHSEGFTEKPDQETAIRFLSTGAYSWNSGMFIWDAGQMLAEFRRQRPVTYALFEEIERAIGDASYRDTLDRLWPQMERLSVDYAIMEGARKMAVIPVDIGWSDIGSWSTLFDVLEGDPDGNVTRGEGNSHIRIDTKGTLVVSDRMVATIGIENLVIVDAETELLICHRDRAQDVRQIVDQLKKTESSEHL